MEAPPEQRDGGCEQLLPGQAAMAAVGLSIAAELPRHPDPLGAYAQRLGLLALVQQSRDGAGGHRLPGVDDFHLSRGGVVDREDDPSTQAHALGVDDPGADQSRDGGVHRRAALLEDGSGGPGAG